MKVLVIFSGGQDSTTCLGYAMNLHGAENVEAVSFLYGQKHSIELEQAAKICQKHNIRHHKIDISFFSAIVDSALTSNGDVNVPHERLKHLPASYVPNRNAMFITISHALAQKIGAELLYTGVCQTDYSGYPDCRLPFVQSLNLALNSGSDSDIIVKTPLMFLTKAETWALADESNILEDVIELSHTCYNGSRHIRHEWGYGCGNCPACRIRAKGFYEYQDAKKATS